jgi:hypothetical protein
VLKKIAVGASVVALALTMVVVFLGTALGAAPRIARAEAEAAFLREQRDSVLTIVSANDSLQRELSAVRATMGAEVERLEGVVLRLESERQGQQLSVRMISSKPDLQARLRRTFPEMSDSEWAVTDVYDEENDVGIEYLRVPLWFAETFIVDHQNAESYKAQADTSASVINLQKRISALQDSVFALERDSRQAYQNGYEAAYTRYEVLNGDYIRLLKQPRVSLGWKGGVGTMLGTFGLGMLVGR